MLGLRANTRDNGSNDNRRAEAREERTDLVSAGEDEDAEGGQQAPGRRARTAGEHLELLRQRAGEAHERTKQRIQETRAQLEDAHSRGKESAAQQLAKRRRKAQVALLNLSKGMRAKVMYALRESIKSAAVSDKDMPDFVKVPIIGSIDLLWDDLVVYVESTIDDRKETIKGRRVTDIEDLAALGKPRTTCSPMWWRAKLLYHFLPFDVSIIGQTKDFWFWFMMALSMCTFYGIRVAFFTLLLIAECAGGPPDEYQLVQYILMLKGYQFLSSGVCMAMYLGVRYFICVHPAPDGKPGLHTCEENGPAAGSDMISAVVDLVGCCLLGWVAFLLIPRSVRSAGEREVVEQKEEEPNEDEPPKKCCGRYDSKKGGRLQKLLRYDLGCFILSLLFLTGLCIIDIARLRPESPENAKLHPEEWLSEFEDGYYNSYEFVAALYWTRIFYSLLAFPFTIFIIPVLNGIMTHTTPTGYNKQGLCVPYMLWPSESSNEQDIDPLASTASQRTTTPSSRQ